MPESKTVQRAREDKAQGKSASTQAGEFVKEQIDHVREGKHGVRSSKQAIAIGLSEARRAGVEMKPPGHASTGARKKAPQRQRAGSSVSGSSESHHTRSRASTNALKRESSEGASPQALSEQTHRSASRRSAADRSASARKGAETKGASGRAAAARKGARTRATHAASR